MTQPHEVYDVTGFVGAGPSSSVGTRDPAVGSVPTRQVTTTTTRSSGHVATATHHATTTHKKATHVATVHKKAAVKPKKKHPVGQHVKRVPFGEKAF